MMHSNRFSQPWSEAVLDSHSQVDPIVRRIHQVLLRAKVPFCRSDFPSATMDNVIAGLNNVHAIVEGTRLPRVPAEVRDMILHENWKPFFPKWADESVRE
jgi:hypothetical protein